MALKHCTFSWLSQGLWEKKSFRVVWQNYWFNSINGGQPHLQTRVITTSEGSEMRLSHFLSWHLCVMSVRLKNVLKLFFLWQHVPWSIFWWLGKHLNWLNPKFLFFPFLNQFLRLKPIGVIALLFLKAFRVPIIL